ncbi:elongation factor P hydroxylase [Pseudoalteromonas nigrifaciens]|uniref:elongation factor P hydroxylase n=1 Tax=Pseudoalteromonas nigrifaciens TaxID=28109 RepID=UPI0017885B51|nr:elongation factor P hydroxylase [Pseudoalteromonas nigrifaciens]MBE0421816.1 elongation factor P hydroxylase [Pseudoalteromonas nigrifaciens]
MHKIADLISIFAATFDQSYNTWLVKGEHEPIYIPSCDKTPYHQIVFAHGFYASALHEIAHWLVAGDKRRLLEDYGYWYCPDGRDKQKQAEFENVEIKPQAIEWLLSTAAGFEFNVSVDNLNGEQTCRFDFQQRVHQQVLTLINNGFNSRTEALLKALSHFYNTPWPMSAQQFNWQHPKELKDAV